MITHTWVSLKAELFKVLNKAGTTEFKGVNPQGEFAITSAMHNKAEIRRLSDTISDHSMGENTQRIATIDIKYRWVNSDADALDKINDQADRCSEFLAYNGNYTYATTGILSIDLTGTRQSASGGVIEIVQSIAVRYYAPKYESRDNGRNW